MNQLEDALLIHQLTRGDPRIVIAILDGPVDLNHKSLVGADLRDLSIVPCQSNPSNGAAFHGTHVCSIVFGQGPGGIRGIAPNCRGVVIPIFRDGPTPGSILPCSQVELAVAIDRAVTAGANIINISGGQASASGTVHPILKRVIDRAAESGVLIVSATGNDSCRCHHIPSAYSTVLAVGAHDENGEAIESSNWGERYRVNGVVALGQNVLGAVPGGTRQGSGTSFATPIVTGIAALLMSCQLKTGQPVDGARVQKAIIDSAERCFESTESCQRMLAGKLNPLGALNRLLEESKQMNHEFESTQTMINPNLNVPTDSRISAGLQPSAEVVLPSTIPPRPTPVNDSAGIESTFARNPSYENHSSAEMFAPQPAALDRPAALQAPSQQPQAGIQPSNCGCSCSASGALVYVIGEIGFDFGTEARRDSITAHIIAAGLGDSHPIEEERLARYLQKNPWDANAIIWTISLNNVPIYAVRPGGPFAPEAFRQLVEFLDDNHKGTKKRSCNHVAIPGRIVGQATLLRTGQNVPVIEPEIRGMANWGTRELVDASLSEKERKDKDLVSSLTKILEKIYCEHQNLGIRPQDRAINYAASNTTELKRMIVAAKSNDSGTLFFDNIECEPSAICRPGSECWVIKINFFVHDQTDRSRRMYRFTVDVSDIVPVSLSDMQDWYVR